MYSNNVFLQGRTTGTTTTSDAFHTLVAVSICVVPQDEPKLMLEACQPFFRLSREQVRQFAHMLGDAQSLLLKLYPVEQHLEWDEEAERRFLVADQMLAAKIRFVARSPSLRYPAVLGLDKLITELTREELAMLETEVSFHSYDLDIADAVCFYAVPPLAQSLQHLQTKEQRNIRGPVLCGAYPPPAEQPSRRNVWILFVCNDQPKATKQHPLCQRCLDLWTQYSVEKKNNT